MMQFLNLKQINSRFQKEFEIKYQDFLESGNYILGQNVSNFETNFASFCGVKHCVGTGSGLDALTLIFKAYIQLGRLKEGDEIVVPANTYIASILAIINSGLTPVLIEPDIETYNISVNEIKKVITKKTKAILVVHLYGQIAYIDEISDIAKSNNLLVIEDAAQAHGAINVHGKKTGSLANASGFSFYPTKPLGALGDGGAITTNDDDLEVMARQLGNYGQTSKNNHDYIGYNSRLDDIQAMFLDIKLKYLDDDNYSRIKIAKQYLSEIKSDKITLPYFSGEKDHVFHQFVIRVNKRDDFRMYLQSKNIQTLVHYPIAPHQQKAMSTYRNINLPITEKIHQTIVSLPIYSTMPVEYANKIIDYINTY